MQKGVLLDRAASFLLVQRVAILAGRCRRSNVGDRFGIGVLAADLGDADVSCLAGLGKGIVAAVEVLALLTFRLAFGT